MKWFVIHLIIHFYGLSQCGAYGMLRNTNIHSIGLAQKVTVILINERSFHFHDWTLSNKSYFLLHNCINIYLQNYNTKLFSHLKYSPQSIWHEIPNPNIILINMLKKWRHSKGRNIANYLKLLNNVVTKIEKKGGGGSKDWRANENVELKREKKTSPPATTMSRYPWETFLNIFWSLHLPVRYIKTICPLMYSHTTLGQTTNQIEYAYTEDTLLWSSFAHTLLITMATNISANSTLTLLKFHKTKSITDNFFRIWQSYVLQTTM